MGREIDDLGADRGGPEVPGGFPSEPGTRTGSVEEGVSQTLPLGVQPVSGPHLEICGDVAPGFERVADEFRRNFTEREDVGAALSVVLEGTTVVDLWGGLAEAGRPDRPWRQDTLQVIYSGTKGLVAACVLMLIERGQLELDQPVAKYWPEFGVEGKDRITVAEAVSHRARLPAIRAPLEERDLTDDVRMAELLAAQAAEDDPRATGVYHSLTYGWLCGELIRRLDGRSVGRFFAEEIARPLGLEIWIGLPGHLEPRVSKLTLGADWDSSFGVTEEDLARDPLKAAIFANPKVRSKELSINTRAFHASEIPGGNAIGTARSLARFYACLACGGELDGVRLMMPETIALGRRELSQFIDPFVDRQLRFGVGFALQSDLREFGPPHTGFGHGGAGGSVHAAWPDQRLGVSYVMNEMRFSPDRTTHLLSALFDVLQA